MKSSSNNNSCNDDDDQQDHVKMQVDEIVALSQIYADEFQLLSARRSSSSSEDDGGDNLQDDAADYLAYEHPIRYQIRLSAPSSRITKRLIVEYPLDYPDVAPRFSVEEEVLPNTTARGEHQQNRLALLEEAIQGAVEVGMPCVMQCVQAGLDFLEQPEEERVGDDEDDNQAAVSEDERSDLLREALPRPLLLMILDRYCTLGDRGRLSVCATFWNDLLERRAQRALLSVDDTNCSDNADNDDDDDNDEWLLSGNGMMVDTVWKEPWELDVRRAKEERQISTFQEQLWKRQHSVDFAFSLPRGAWRIREGLLPRPVAAPVLCWETARHCFHYTRTTRAIAKQKKQWYLVRVRLRALRPNDGDIFVGLVRKSFDQAPAASFGGPGPNSGFGAESEQCALVNVVSGQNPAAGSPLEVNLGLIVMMQEGIHVAEYGIPIDSYLGRPEFNNGKVSSSLQSSTAEGGSGSDDADDVHVAVVATASTEQTNLFASVTIQECLQKEWDCKMVRPYNTI